jgi:hypothetical protein
MTVTAPEVKAELAVSADAVGLSEGGFNSLLDALITRETERVEDEIDIALGTETVTEAVSRPASVNEYDLPLSHRPVQSVASVTIDTDRVGRPDVTVPEDIVVEDTHLALSTRADRRAWPTERRAVAVEYTHGYPESNIPEPIAGAIIGLVRHAVQEIESDGIESESIDGQSVTYELGDDVVRRHLLRAKRFDAPEYYGGSQVI